MIIPSFLMFIRQIFADSMLAVTCVAPFLAGVAFRFGLPAIDILLARHLGLENATRPWWLLADLFLCVLAPFMFCFASSMVILEERDEGVSAYLTVTPVGKTGYLVSRLVLPALLAAPVSVLVLSLFGLSGMDLPLVLILSSCMPLVALILSLLITSLSGNRVEGMAVAKLSGLILAGLAVPFFVRGPEKYWAAPLPTFWLAEFAASGTVPPALAFFAVCALWLAVLLFHLTSGGRSRIFAV